MVGPVTLPYMNISEPSFQTAKQSKSRSGIKTYNVCLYTVEPANIDHPNPKVVAYHRWLPSRGFSHEGPGRRGMWIYKDGHLSHI